MPELPEVQTIVSELTKKISGKKIAAVSVLADKSINLSQAVFINKILGKKVLGVHRRAKMILIELTGSDWLLIHLKMTGQLVYVPKQGKIVTGGHPIAVTAELPNKSTRVFFEFQDGSILYFNDTRRFGWVRFVDQQKKNEEVSKYGLEPLETDFTLGAFTAILNRYPNRKIKQVLLDQSLIAGIGNIYADEAVFAAGVLPSRPAGKINELEITKLFNAITKILKLSIKHGGTTARDYVRSDGSKGGMIKYLRVYGRANKKCHGCHNMIIKTKINGRGTHYCGACQS